MTIPEQTERGFVSRFHEYTRTLDCVHCGLCIQDCPTHGITGKEADSPRGRIYLMRGYAEGSMPFTEDVRRHLDQCIVCRACETVCPSGIHMGDMMESFRHEMHRSGESRGPGYWLARFFLRHVLPFRSRIAAISDLIYVYQRCGLRRLVGAVAGRASARFASLDALQPVIPEPASRRIETDRTRPEGYPAEGKSRIRVGLFLGCITSEWFAPTHHATIRVLQRNGCDVVLPEAQTCCGALHRHGGFLEDARDLHARNAKAFSDARVDVIVVNAAGCGAALKEPPPDGPEDLGAPVRDICEFLDEIGLRPPRARIERKVVYDQPCHLLHGQGVGAGVVEGLLAAVPGLELLPLVDSERCCGSGGVYNLVHPELAEPIRAEKVQRIVESGADLVVTGNPGCALQIRAGLAGTDIEVLHPVDVLDTAYRQESAEPSTPTG